MNWLLPAPLLIPLVAAAASLLTWKWLLAQRFLGLLGTAGLVVVTVALLFLVQKNGIQAVQVGNWPAPFGITLVVDLFSAIMLVIASLMGLAIMVYSAATIDSLRARFGYYPLLLLLLMGVCGAFLTGDIFNLYVFFEVLLIASFVLMALGGEREQMEGAVKYVALNLLSSALFLAAVGILYGMVGTLNMADLAHKLSVVSQTGQVTAVAMLFLIAFGIKAAIFPLFFWLPASYHTPPVAVSAIFAALLTKVGVYSLVRIFTLVFVQDAGYIHNVLLIVAGLTMVTGVLGAVAQYDFRRLLSFHIVSQIGYLIMGLGLFTPLAVAGSIYFLVHVILAKSALFMVSGLTHQAQGTFDLKKMGGLYRTRPDLALLFLLPALSLAGIPPLSGFFAKLALVRGGLEAQSYAIAGVALLVSILTLFSMIKIWNEVFWKDQQSPEDGDDGRTLVSPDTVKRSMIWATGSTTLVVGLSVLTGIAAQPLFALSLAAARQLLDPTEYIVAVLGG